MSIIADHLSHVKPSAISLVTAKASQLEREGRKIIRLSAGEPDCGTPDHIKQAGIRAIQEGKTQYPLCQGIMELREAVCQKLKRVNDLSYSLEETIISSGCKQVLFNGLAATLNPGDEVILPTPYWISYPNMVGINRGVPVFVKTRQEDLFKMTPQALGDAITERTKWVLINNPGNPSGAVYSQQELEELAEVLRKHPHVWVLSDDIYEHMVFDGIKFYTIAQVAPDLKDRTLVVNGVSKGYSMTGWRVGYGAGPKELIKTMFKIQSQSTSGANTMSQWAAITALNGDQSFIRDYNETLTRRRDLVVSTMNRIDGLTCCVPEGAFYCYISCAGVIGRKTPKGDLITSDLDFCTFLMEECGVAVVHGEAFGLSPYFRISYATDIERLEVACGLIASTCALLS